MTNPVLDAALAYDRLGLCCIKMHVRSKRPALRSWERYQTERPTTAEVRKWFSAGDRGIGIVLGEVSQGLVVRDFDQLDAYHAWAKRQPELAQTLPTVETARGRHVYALGDIGAVKARFKSSIVVLDDGELRAGGLVVAPPSIHPSGALYRWQTPLTGLPPLLDVVAAGFVPCNIENREDLEHREDRGNRDAETTEIPKIQRTSVVDVFVSAFKVNDFAPETLEAIRGAVRRTVPAGKGQRHRLVFELCRELKAIPAIADAEPLQLTNVLKAWWERAREHSPTPWEEHLADFLEGWGRVKFPRGAEPMALIFQRATEADLPEVAQQFEQQPLRLLVALCRELQRATKDGPFYLSSRTAGRLLGVDHTTAHRWLIFLKNLSILELTEAGSQNPKDRKASRYRYLPPV